MGHKGGGKTPAAKDGAGKGGPKGTDKALAGQDVKGTGKAPAGKDGAGKDGLKGTGKDPAAGKDGAGKGGPKGTGKADGGKTRLSGGGKPHGKDGGKSPDQSTTAPATNHQPSGKGKGPSTTKDAPHTPPAKAGVQKSPNTGTPPTKPAETNGTVVAPNKPTNPGPKGTGCKGGKGTTSAATANASPSEEGAKGQNPKSKGKGDVSRKVLWANQEDSVRRRVSFDGGRTSYLQNRVQQQYILI